MTAARLTAAEARRLGIDTPGPACRTTRKEVSGDYWSRCVTCGAEFTTIASEDRHNTLIHARFDTMSGTPMYQCDKCGRYTYSLDRHRCRAARS